MSLNCFSLPTNFTSPSLTLFKPKRRPNFIQFYPNYSSIFTCQLGITFEDITAIAQNKVLISAGLSAVVGQFSKPFASVLLYGNTLDFRAIIQAGGFPSTHSSAVMATATSLALERGFSDSIFGLTLVYAGLVMYDAQGVRREVGIHAKTINRSLLDAQLKSGMEEEEDEDITKSVRGQSSPTNLGSSNLSEEPNALRKKQNATPLLIGSILQKSMTKIEKGSVRPKSYALLKESIGHTEVEVIAGAFLGFLVSLTVHAVM